MYYLFIDFETQSESNITKIDVVNYVTHKTTKVACTAWYLTKNVEEVSLEDIALTWDTMPNFSHLTELTVVAHNASFEQAVIRQFFPDFLPDNVKWVDTMALASINNVRRSLEQSVNDCGLKVHKFIDGKLVMRRLNSSKNPTTLDNLTEQEKENLATYCKQDVLMTISLYLKLISTFTKQEHEIWDFTNRENWKGVDIDMELALKGQERIANWQKQVPQMISELTKGEVTAINQVARLSKYLGVPDVRAETLIAQLKIETDPTKILVMKLRLEGGKKSVSKFESAVLRQYQGKLYHCMDYHAAATGRFASKGVQLQNLIKADKEIAEEVITELKNDTPWPFESTMSRASKAIRGLFIPPAGYDLIKADYSQVEARILAWLVNDEELLNDFATGKKIYEKMAAIIFNVPVEDVDEKQRFYGKSAVLGCGYGMGAAKFQMTYKVSEELAERSVAAYRKKNYRVTRFWRKLEDAIKIVIINGQPVKISKLIIWRDSWRLFIKLPSGRNLVYPYPRVAFKKIYHKTRKQAQFTELSYWGGTFLENICQAISRDLLTSALLALRYDETFKFMFTVHDELVYYALMFCYTIEEFNKVIIDSAPDWAIGLPLAVDIEVYNRYFK